MSKIRRIWATTLISTEEEQVDELTTSGSFLGNLHQLAAFAAAAGVAQEVRNGLAPAGRRFSLEVVDIPMAIDAYFEAVILAGILRTLLPKEIRHRSQDHLIADAVARLPGEHYPGLLPEIGWAAAKGKLPPQPIQERMREAASTHPAAAMLRALIALGHG